MCDCTGVSQHLVFGLLKRRLQWTQASFIHLADEVKNQFWIFFSFFSEQETFLACLKKKKKKAESIRKSSNSLFYKKSVILIEKCINHAALSAQLVSSQSACILVIWKRATLTFWMNLEVFKIDKKKNDRICRRCDSAILTKAI